MYKKLNVVLLNAALLYSNLGLAAVYYVDPVKGSSNNPGTADLPWKTLEEVVNKRLIETKTAKGVTKNKGAPVKSGDTILLRSGFHGYVRIYEAYNDNFITVKAEKENEPKLSYLEVSSGKNWRFEKLTVSPSFANKNHRYASIVILGENDYWGKSSNLEIIDSYIYHIEDSSGWSKQDWSSTAKSGILIGRNTENSLVKNNYIKNVSFGIKMISEDATAEGNIIDSFSGDGIRACADNNIVKYNVITNNRSVDENHDDGIQAFSRFNDIQKDLNISNNIILNRDAFASNGMEGYLHGIGLFDGPYRNINIAENVALSFSWHGVGLVDAQSSVVANNVLYTPSQVDKLKARVTLGSKLTKDLSTLKNVEIYGNYASDYNFPEKYKSSNTLLTGDQKFLESLNKLANIIDDEYGEIHPVAKKPRFNKQVLTHGIETIFSANQTQKLNSDSQDEKLYSKNMVFDAGNLKNSYGQNAKYVWDFGDGSSAEGQVVRHTYPSTCSYPVTVIVKDQYGREIDSSDESWLTIDISSNSSKNTSVFVNE